MNVMLIMTVFDLYPFLWLGPDFARNKGAPRQSAFQKSPGQGCFAAELEIHLLTPSHDMDMLVAPITIDVLTGTEELHIMDGKRQQNKANDMMMTDGEGVVCNIIYGQDKRRPVTTATKRVVYVDVCTGWGGGVGRSWTP